MTTDELRAKIEAGLDHHEAAILCDSLKDVPQGALYMLLFDCGVTTIRAKDSRPMMLKRLKLALTARVRSIERNEV